MEKELYKEIFKRKSFHTFRERNEEIISKEELKDIENAFYHFDALNPDIKVKIKIVETKETNCYAKGEYAILIYSENKDNYLLNVGYLGEQLDLYLVSKGIGSLWFGIGRESIECDGLEYVIKIIIGKVNNDKFRKDMFKSKRKSLTETWSGETIDQVSEIARFAPSACNSQPWFVENISQTLSIYRYTKNAKVSLMKPDVALYFNQIDMGIYLCILELCLLNKKMEFKRELIVDSGHIGENVLVAKYIL